MPLGLSHLDVMEPHLTQIAEELGLKLVAVNQHQIGRILESGVFDEPARYCDHRVGLARALRVPNQPAPLFGIERAPNHALLGAHLMRPQHHLGELVVLAGKQDKFRQHAQNPARRHEGLDQRFKVARLLVAPVVERFA